MDNEQKKGSGFSLWLRNWLFKEKKWVPVAYGLFLIAFTVWIALDTFVVDDIDYSELSGAEASLSAGGDFSGFAKLTQTPTPTAEDEDLEVFFPGIVPDGYWDNPYGDYSKKDNAALGSEEQGEVGTEVIFTPTPTATNTPTPTPIPPTYTENSYMDENMTLTITKYRETISNFESTFYVVDVQLKSAEYLKAGLARTALGKGNGYTSEIAKGCNAILAINGDCYGNRGGSGYVIRNGVALRENYYVNPKSQAADPNQEDCVIFCDGHMEIIREGDESVQSLISRGAWNLWSFGPALIKDGKDVLSGKSKSELPDITFETNAGRTAIGIYDELHYCFIVEDGRAWNSSPGYLGLLSHGVTCKQLIDFAMKRTPGLTYLYNLDGGGSSTLYFNGQVINNPCRTGKVIAEQTVNDIIYLGY